MLKFASGEALTGKLSSTGEVSCGEIFTVTAQRLVRYGCTESQAYTLAQVITLKRTSSDSEVEQAVIRALVSVKQSVDGPPEIEYVTGRRCDVQRRLEGR